MLTQVGHQETIEIDGIEITADALKHFGLGPWLTPSHLAQAAGLIRAWDELGAHARVTVRPSGGPDLRDGVSAPAWNFLLQMTEPSSSPDRPTRLGRMWGARITLDQLNAARALVQ